MITKSISDVTIKSVEEGTVEAVFARFDVVDKDGDVTRKGAFDEGAAVVISAYGHKSWDGDLPVGMGTIHEVGDTAVLKGRFFLDTQHGADTFRTVKALSESGLQEWSYSLQDISAERGTFGGKSVQFLNKVFVKEVSPTLVGAGIGTGTTAIKAHIDDDLAAAAPVSQRFSEHLASVVADVEAIAARKTEIVALRAEKGKGLAPGTDVIVDRIEKALVALRGDIVSPTEPIQDDDARREFLRFVAISQGVTS